MPDTKRTLAEIIALSADNETGNISPQDLRDIIVSLTPSYGGVYMAGNTTATTIATIDTLVVSNWGANGLITSATEFTVTTGGRLTYTGTSDRHCHVVCSLAAHITVNAAKSLIFAIFKNGVEVIGSRMLMESTGNQDDVSTALHCDVMMSEDDYLEVYTADETDTNDITITHAYLFAQTMLS